MVGKFGLELFEKGFGLEGEGVVEGDDAADGEGGLLGQLLEEGFNVLNVALEDIAEPGSGESS